jgi:4-amino-4-deoxy-L-arabinose transferase-like glycosyltransferase
MIQSKAQSSALERAFLWVIILAFIAVELNCIHNDAYMGQDWPGHLNIAAALRATPHRWFYVDATNRPVVYWISNAWRAYSSERVGELTAITFMLFNATALVAFYACLTRFIAASWIRLAAVAFVAFLPATLITSIVFAGDAVVMLPFAACCWALLRSVEATSARERWIFALVAGLALSIGQFCKLPFMLLLCAVVFVTWALKRCGRITTDHAILITLLAAVAPGCVAFWVDRECRKEVAHEPLRHGFNWNEGRGNGRMEWKSLLGVKPSDLDVLSAPGYFEPAPDNLFPPLLIRNNHFSYLPLLHVCIFTDVMDFANKGNKDNGAPRPEPQRTFAKLAVRGGLLFFIPVILSMAVFCVETLYGFVDPRKMPEAGPLIWGCFSLCWYLPIALTLPFVLEPYLEGYFLPRLVIPAV